MAERGRRSRSVVRVCVAAWSLARVAGHWSEGRRGPIDGVNAMPEDARVEAFHANGYEWPPTMTWKGWPPQPNGPESESYAKSRDAIEAWVRNIDDSNLKWNEWTTLVQSRVMPSFTEKGFELHRCPDDLFQELNASFFRGLADLHTRKEGGFGGVSDVNRPLFIDQQALNDKVMHAMHRRMEAWAGVPLYVGQSYGVRVYRNGSNLINHVDRSATHVISFILHIGSRTMQPWEIQIEDHDGAVHSVALSPGDMLYYESSKQYHARYAPMNGEYFGSLFTHYYPKGDWDWDRLDFTTAVPPDWRETIDELEDPERRRRLREAGKPGIQTFYKDFWEAKGWDPKDVPPFPVGIYAPVQSICDLPHMCASNATRPLPSGVGEEL